MTSLVQDHERPQTPAQWAVRWHGLVAAALLVGSVPLVHVAWHGVLGHQQPPVVLRSQIPAPPVQWGAMADGSWMLTKERQLREDSPIVWQLRSAWNECLLRMGLGQSATVHIGKHGWLFLKADVAPAVQQFQAWADVRTRTFAAVRDQVRAAGAELCVMVVPDKSRIYPEAAFGGEVGPAKAPIYGRLQQELGAAGILSVDLAQGLGAVRAAAPGEDLYYHGDTHWRAPGALAAAQLLATVLGNAPIAQRLSPRHAMQLGARSTYLGVGDLVTALGIGTAEFPDATGQRRSRAVSLLAQTYTEALDFYAVVPGPGAPALRLDGEDPDAEILLVGTSYSDVNGLKALMLALGRPIRMVQENGAASITPMRRALAELREPGRPRPKLVIWEIVERGFFEEPWRDPKF